MENCDYHSRRILMSNRFPIPRGLFILEDMIVAGDFIPLQKAEGMERPSRALCKITLNKFPGFPYIIARGSGFLCRFLVMGGDIELRGLLTNNHVISRSHLLQNGESCVLHFEKLNKGVKLVFEQCKYFFSCKHLDATFIVLSDDAVQAIGPDAEYLSVSRDAGIANMLITIIQHPGGGSAKAAGGHIERLSGCDFYTLVNTMRGSSGSPVLNNADNNVVALHKSTLQNLRVNCATNIRYIYNSIKKDYERCRITGTCLPLVRVLNDSDYQELNDQWGIVASNMTETGFGGGNQYFRTETKDHVTGYRMWLLRTYHSWYWTYTDVDDPALVSDWHEISSETPIAENHDSFSKENIVPVRKILRFLERHGDFYMYKRKHDMPPHPERHEISPINALCEISLYRPAADGCDKDSRAVKGMGFLFSIRMRNDVLLRGLLTSNKVISRIDIKDKDNFTLNFGAKEIIVNYSDCGYCFTCELLKVTFIELSCEADSELRSANAAYLSCENTAFVEKDHQVTVYQVSYQPTSKRYQDVTGKIEGIIGMNILHNVHIAPVSVGLPAFSGGKLIGIQTCAKHMCAANMRYIYDAICEDFIIWLRDNEYLTKHRRLDDEDFVELKEQHHMVCTDGDRDENVCQTFKQRTWDLTAPYFKRKMWFYRTAHHWYWSETNPKTVTHEQIDWQEIRLQVHQSNKTEMHDNKKLSLSQRVCLRHLEKHGDYYLSKLTSIKKPLATSSNAEKCISFKSVRNVRDAVCLINYNYYPREQGQRGFLITFSLPGDDIKLSGVLTTFNFRKDTRFVPMGVCELTFESMRKKVYFKYRNEDFYFSCNLLGVVFLQLPPETLRELRKEGVQDLDYSTMREAEDADIFAVFNSYANAFVSAKITSYCGFFLWHEIRNFKSEYIPMGSPILNSDGHVIALQSSYRFDFAVNIQNIRNAIIDKYKMYNADKSNPEGRTPDKEDYEELKQLLGLEPIDLDSQYFVLPAEDQVDTSGSMWFASTHHHWYWTKTDPHSDEPDWMEISASSQVAVDQNGVESFDGSQKPLSKREARVIRYLSRHGNAYLFKRQNVHLDSPVSVKFDGHQNDGLQNISQPAVTVDPLAGGRVAAVGLVKGVFRFVRHLVIPTSSVKSGSDCDSDLQPQ